MSAASRIAPAISTLTRRRLIASSLGAAASLAFGGPAWAAQHNAAFARWVAAFEPRAEKRGVSTATYRRVMNSVTPDMSVFEPLRAQPEFTQKLWQYINRRCSEWRVVTGQERAREHASLLP